MVPNFNTGLFDCVVVDDCKSLSAISKYNTNGHLRERVILMEFSSRTSPAVVMCC